MPDGQLRTNNNKTSSHTLATIDQQQIRNAMREKMLLRDEEHDLAVRWRDHRDPKALDKLIRPYMRLTISIARRFKNYGLQMNDLIQEGHMGMVLAANRFDPDREVRFSTYASWWIKASIQDFVLRNWSIVRTGTTTAHKALFFNFKRIKAKIDGMNDGPLSQQNRQRVADDLGVRLSDVELMEGRLLGADRSLNAPVVGHEDGFEWQDILADDDNDLGEQVEYNLDRAKSRTIIDQALENLNDREALIIKERRLQTDTITLASLGEKLGVSKERVRQIEAQALEKLKKHLIALVGDPVKAGLIGL